MGTNADDDGRNYIAVAMPKDENEVYVNQFTTSGQQQIWKEHMWLFILWRLSMSKNKRFSKVYRWKW